MEVKKAQNISPNPYINNDSQNNSLNDKIDKKKRYQDIYDLLYGINNKNEEEKIEGKKLKKKSISHRKYKITNLNNFNVLGKNKQKSTIYDDKISLLYDKIYSLQKKSLKKINFQIPIKSNNTILMNQHQNKNEKIDFNNNNKLNIKSQFQKYSFDNSKKNLNHQPYKLFKHKMNIYDPILTYESNNYSNRNSNYNTINNVQRVKPKNFLMDKRNEIRDLLNFNNINTNHYRNINVYNSFDKKKYSGNYFANELKRFTYILNNSERINSKTKRVYSQIE